MPFRKTRCGKPNQSVLVRERQLDFHDVAAIEPIDKARYSTLRNPDRPCTLWRPSPSPLDLLRLNEGVEFVNNRRMGKRGIQALYIACEILCLSNPMLLAATVRLSDL
jgi:hypothetical protein